MVYYQKNSTNAPFSSTKRVYGSIKKLIFATMGIIQKRHLIYIPFIVAAMVVIGIYCFQVGIPGNSRPPEPGMFQGPPPMMQDGSMPPPQSMDGKNPPPDGMRPPKDESRPPLDGMRPGQMPNDKHRPMRPETMKMLISLLIIGVLWGIMYYFRNLKAEKKNKELWMENQRNQDKIEELSRVADNVQKAESDLLFKTDYKQVRIKPDEILYIEGMAEYLKINYISSPTPLIVHLSMKRILEQLPDDRFMRIHKSYIVNCNRITGSNRTQVTIENGTTLPIGESYRKLFAERNINS